MIRAFIKLALVLAIVYAGIRCVPVYMTYVQLSDQIRETAKFAGTKTEAQVLERIETIARNMDVTFDDLRVEKQDTVTLVHASYTARFEWFPRQVVPHVFTINVAGEPSARDKLVP